jgi:hypothetical protein
MRESEMKIFALNWKLFFFKPFFPLDQCFSTGVPRRDAQVCHQIFLGVPPNLKMAKNYAKTVSFSHLYVPTNLLSK